MIGQMVGRYRVLEFLGHGESGAVYRAEDLDRHRMVALKIVAPELLRPPGAAERIDRELAAAATLENPAIPRIYEEGRDENYRYVAMQLFDGTTLENRMRQGRIPPGEAVQIAADVAAALDHAHRRGVVHRDLKAAHVLLSPQGARVLGFGMTPPGPHRPVGSSELWQSSISPEELEGQEPDARSDLFRLGALLYEMVTGRRPYAGEGAHEIRRAIREEIPAPPSSLRSGLPKSLDRFLEKALQRRPEDRHPDAAAFLADLAPAGDDLNALLLAHQPLPKRRRRHFGTLLPTLAAIALLVIIGLLWRALKLSLD